MSFSTAIETQLFSVNLNDIYVTAEIVSPYKNYAGFLADGLAEGVLTCFVDL